MVPDAAERAMIQTHQSLLAQGKPPHAPMQAFFRQLLTKYQAYGCESVVLACTELPLAITHDLTDLTLIDPLNLQCQAAVDFALNEMT